MRIGFQEDHAAGGKTRLHVDETLVRAAAPYGGAVLFCQDEGAVHEHVQVGQDLSGLSGPAGEDLFPRPAGVGPYVEAFFPYRLSDAPRRLRLPQRVAAGKGDAIKIARAQDVGDDVLRIGDAARMGVPRLWILAGPAVMGQP